MVKIRRIISFFAAIILSVVLTSAAFAEDAAVTGYAGNGDSSYRDGKQFEAAFNRPYGMAKDRDGGLIVVDSYNNRIRKIRDGKVATIAGFCDKTDAYGFPEGGYVDGAADESRFNKPRYAVVDKKGSIYVSDTGNNAIRKITGGKVFTFAGGREEGYANGKVDSAKFNMPSGLALDKQNNIYVADTLNHVIRKITPEGYVSTYAGKFKEKGGYRDGDCDEAFFNEPSDLAMDKDGALYVLDSGNQLVRMVKDNKVTTVAGSAAEQIPGTNYKQGGFQNGKCERAMFNFPMGIDIALDGTILIADTWNHRVRAIKTDGSVVTVTGTGLIGKTNGKLSKAQFNGPVDLLYDSGTLYISDMWNNLIRVITADIETLTGISDRAELLHGIDLSKEIDDTQVWFDKERVVFPDIQPFISGQKVYFPMRFVFEAWGADVIWCGETRSIEVKKKDFVRMFTIGKDSTFLEEGRTFMDIEVFADITGLRVEWFPEHNAVIVSLR